MIPTSPRSIQDSRRDGRNHHYYPPNLEWTPPESDSETPPMPRSLWPNRPTTLRFIDNSSPYRESPRQQRRHLQRPYCAESRYDRFRDDDNVGNNFYPSNGATRMARSFVQAPPTMIDCVPGRSNSPLVTAPISPIRSRRRRRMRRQLSNLDAQYGTGQPVRRIANRRREGRNIADPSRDASAMPTRDLPHLPSLSTTFPRSNKIYVRIKRAVKEKSTRTKTENRQENRCRFDSHHQSMSVPNANMQSVNHHHHHHHASTYHESNPSLSLSIENPSSFAHRGWNRGRPAEVDADTRFDDESLPALPFLPDSPRTNEAAGYMFETRACSPKHPFTDKFLKAQSLLAIEDGPISWHSIGETGEPPESFVWYLAEVLTEGVQVYLINNTGKEYWIKHVRFWSDLLDPNSDRWNNNRGSRYRGYAKRLNTSLLERWGGSETIECQDARDRSLLVRVCILYARKNTDRSNHYTRDRYEPIW